MSYASRRMSQIKLLFCTNTFLLKNVIPGLTREPWQQKLEAEAMGEC